MSEKKTGGPAFPEVLRKDKKLVRVSGMSLRDHFAGLAMQALINQGPQIQEHTKDGVLIRPARVEIPPIAYEYADAMLKAREA